MKVKFTLEDMDAIEVAYWDNEGYAPSNINHVSEEKEYQILQKLWLRMAKHIKKGQDKE